MKNLALLIALFFSILSTSLSAAVATGKALNQESIDVSGEWNNQESARPLSNRQIIKNARKVS